MGATPFSEYLKLPLIPTTPISQPLFPFLLCFVTYSMTPEHWCEVGRIDAIRGLTQASRRRCCVSTGDTGRLDIEGIGVRWYDDLRNTISSKQKDKDYTGSGPLIGNSPNPVGMGLYDGNHRLQRE